MHVFSRGPLRLPVPVVIYMSDNILFTANVEVDNSTSLEPVKLT